MKKNSFFVYLIIFWCTRSYAAFPDINEICINSKVDTDKLATSLLQNYNVNIADIVIPSGKTNISDIYRYLIENSYNLTKFCPDKNQKCTDTDKTNINMISIELVRLFNGTYPSFNATSNSSNDNVISSFFAGKVDLKCAQSIEKPGQEIQGSPKVLDSNLFDFTDVRVRGGVDDLIYDRKQKNNFSTAKAAVLSYSSDSVSHKNTETFTGALGLNWLNANKLFNNDINYHRFEIMPYVGVNRLIITGTKPSANETVDVGLSTDYFFSAGKFDIGFFNIFRPHYLMDLQSNSRIVSFNERWIPFTIGLNDYHRFGQYISFKPVFDFRIDGGSFTDRGIASVSKLNKDYLRTGGQGGGALIFNFFSFPVTLITTYTGLYGAISNINVEYLSSTLNIMPFPQQKYLVISANYSNGNLEDNAAKVDRIWTVGISGKY